MSLNPSLSVREGLKRPRLERTALFKIATINLEYWLDMTRTADVHKNAINNAPILALREGDLAYLLLEDAKKTVNEEQGDMFLGGFIVDIIGIADINLFTILTILPTEDAEPLKEMLVDLIRTRHKYKLNDTNRRGVYIEIELVTDIFNRVIAEFKKHSEKTTHASASYTRKKNRLREALTEIRVWLKFSSALPGDTLIKRLSKNIDVKVILLNCQLQVLDKNVEYLYIRTVSTTGLNGLHALLSVLDPTDRSTLWEQCIENTVKEDNLAPWYAIPISLIITILESVSAVLSRPHKIRSLGYMAWSEMNKRGYNIKKK